MCLLLSAAKITKIYAREGGGVVPVEFGFFPAEYWACLIFFCSLAVPVWYAQAILSRTLIKDRGPDKSISSVLDLRKLSHIFNYTWLVVINKS